MKEAPSTGTSTAGAAALSGGTFAWAEGRLKVLGLPFLTSLSSSHTLVYG